MRLFCVISLVVLLSCKESTSVNHIGPLASVTMGGENACGLTPDGVAYCWGINATGGLGDGTVAASRVPVAVAGSLRFATISATARFVCGVTTTSNGYCWGFNADGNLGIGTTAGPSQCSTLDPRTNQPSWCSTVPIAVTGGVAFSSISAGGLGTVVFPNDDAFACGIAVGGAAYCWGGNGYGELGDSSQTDRSVPTLVAGGLSFTQISTGRIHACGITVNEIAYCWGSDCGGQVGDSTAGSGCPGGPFVSKPVPVRGGLTFRNISASSWNSFTCGVTTSDDAYCWGTSAALGNDTVTTSSIPLLVADSLKFSIVTAGNFHACGLLNTGSAYCWGENQFGQLGDSSLSDSRVPIPVAGGHVFTHLSAGGNSTCGVTIDGAAYCWGDDVVGQLGDGGSSQKTYPVRIAGVP